MESEHRSNCLTCGPAGWYGWNSKRFRWFPAYIAPLENDFFRIRAQVTTAFALRAERVNLRATPGADTKDKQRQVLYVQSGRVNRIEEIWLGVRVFTGKLYHEPHCGNGGVVVIAYLQHVRVGSCPLFFFFFRFLVISQCKARTGIYPFQF